MTIKYVLKTPNTDNTIDVANQIAAATIAGSQLQNKAVTATQIDDNTITATQIANNTITATQIAAGTITGNELDNSLSLPSGTTLAGDAIALQSSLDAAIKGLSPKGSVRTIFSLSSLTPGGMLPTFNWNGTAQTLTSATNSTLTGPSIGGVTNLAAGDKVLVTFTSSDKQYSGIYDITDAGASGGGGRPIILTRATNFDESAEATFGSYVVVLNGTYANQIWYLQTEGSITLNTTALTFAHWGETGSSYTAGNGIDITSSVISAVSDSGATTPVTVGSGGLSVRSASASQTGAMSSVQYSVVDALASFGKRYASQTTSGTGTVDVNIPFTSAGGALAINSTALVDVVVVSRSTTDATKRCVTRVSFALSRGGSGNSSLVGDVVTVFKEHDINGIGAMTVDALLATDGTGADGVRVTGVAGADIDHDISITTRVV